MPGDFIKKIEKINKAITYTNIKGKNYAQVHERVTGFRREFPEWVIDTNIIAELSDPHQITMKTQILDDKGKLVATGHAMEVKSDNNKQVNFTSHVENCETSAIGRALGNLGIGIENAFASADEVQNAIKTQDLADDPIKRIENCKTTEELNKLWAVYPAWHKEYKDTFSKRKQELL